MNAARWRKIAKVCAILMVAGFVWAWIPVSMCTLDVAGGMTRELNPLTEQHLGKQIGTATSGVEAIPTGFFDRAALAWPVCRTENTIADSAMGWILCIFGFLGLLFSRNQVRLTTVRIDLEGLTTRDSGRARTSTQVPTALDVGDVTIGLSEKDKQLLEAVGDLDHRDESLMLYLQNQTKKAAEPEPALPAHIDGFFCPPGFADKPTLYVDPSSDEATDDPSGVEPMNNPERPFKTLQAALDFARHLVTEQGHKGAMVRLKPGVYQTSADIPDRCVLVNHRLPSEGTFRARLKWLTDQTVEHSDSVTLLTPPDSQYAVKFETGTNQGIFGCHIVGRESVKQAGIVAVTCRSLAIGNCSVEGFLGGAVRLQDSGTELPGGAILLHGCRLHRNESKIGGALYAQRSSVTLIDCIVERNKAVNGGAIYGTDLRAPLTITNSRIAYNRAQLDSSPDLDIQSTKLEEWSAKEGLGGGVYLRRSRLKVLGSEFVENGASVAGGGAALLNCKAILEEDDTNRCRFARNKSRIGGGLVLIGAPGSDSTLKGINILAERNTAPIGGAGLAAIGIATLQFVRGSFTENEVTEEQGVGGAVACFLGAELLFEDVELVNNKSAGYGGAIAAIDARVVIKENSRVRGNMARVSGGGIYVVTTNDSVVVELARQKAVKLPFSVSLENVKISNNACSELGGGLRAGNELGRPTLPLGIKIGDGVVFQLNRTRSQVENGDDVWVVWGGEVKATDRDRPPKIVLR